MKSILIGVLCVILSATSVLALGEGGMGGGSISSPTITCSSACSPSQAQLQLGPNITNYGQGAADVTVTLPAAASGLSFVIDIGTTQAGNYFRVTATSDIICGEESCGTLYTNYGFAAPTQYNSMSCRSAKAGASYIWRCNTSHGTPSGS